MNTRKLIGLACWLLAFALPFGPSILNTQGVDNVTGLLSFVATITLIFLGYWLVDSSKPQPTAENNGH